MASSASRLCERLLDGSATAESTGANSSDAGEHQGEDDPANPGECHECLGRVAVREGVALVSAVERAAGAVGKSSGTSKVEDPGEEDGNTVTCDRGDDTTDASEEETELFGRRIEARLRKCLNRMSVHMSGTQSDGALTPAGAENSSTCPATRMEVYLRRLHRRGNPTNRQRGGSELRC